jgi:hypothetical protein
MTTKILRSMRRWSGVAIALLVVTTGINDLGRLVIAANDLDTKTREVAFEAGRVARNAPGSDRMSAWPTAAAAARSRGIEVTGFEQDGKVLTITTRTGMTGTWAIGPAYAIAVRQPLATAFPVTGRATAHYRE